MNKICTDLKQSKKLIELGIDVNTADMCYMYRHWEIDGDTIGKQSDASIGFDSDFYYGADNGKNYHYIPAWSLSALLGLMPFVSFYKSGNKIKIENIYKTIRNNNILLIDAVFEMIVWLLENKKL